MNIDYRVSLWNYYGHTCEDGLEGVIAETRDAGYGIELWNNWDGESLYAPENRDRMKALLDGMSVSMHGITKDDLEGHFELTETAAAIGGDVIVVHLHHFPDGNDGVDLEMMKETALHAKDKGITIALENGPKNRLAEAFDHAGESLRFCLDTGHWCGLKQPLREYLEAFGDRLCHLHLQDPEEGKDHWELGTGINPPEEWQCLKDHLRKIDFDGAGIIEIRPRRPVAVAARSIRFFEDV